MAMSKYRNYLEQDYAEKLAKSESNEYYNGNINAKLEFYDNDDQLMNKHLRFINYMYSTFSKYKIHRNIIIYFYKSQRCTISILNKSVTISRTSLKKIINDSIEEGWVYTKINMKNRREIFILPSKLRIKFWLLYCKHKLLSEIDSELDQARNKLIEYDKLERKKKTFETNIL